VKMQDTGCKSNTYPISFCCFGYTNINRGVDYKTDIISGKGGMGKTTPVGSFAALAENKVIAITYELWHDGACAAKYRGRSIWKTGYRCQKHGTAGCGKRGL